MIDASLDQVEFFGTILMYSPAFGLMLLVDGFFKGKAERLHFLSKYIAVVVSEDLGRTHFLLIYA